MDLGIFLTALGAVMAILATNIGLISWLRSDMKAFETEIRGWKEEIHKESKDFHGRLASLEARWHNDNYHSDED